MTKKSLAPSFFNNPQETNNQPNSSIDNVLWFLRRTRLDISQYASFLILDAEKLDDLSIVFLTLYTNKPSLLNKDNINKIFQNMAQITEFSRALPSLKNLNLLDQDMLEFAIKNTTRVNKIIEATSQNLTEKTSLTRAKTL